LSRYYSVLSNPYFAHINLITDMFSHCWYVYQAWTTSPVKYWSNTCQINSLAR
jgi:hypothetical protein